MDRKRETFADMVAALETAESRPAAGPRYWPLTTGEYVGPDGTRWTAAGGELGWNRLSRLITNAEVRVVHCYLGETREVAVADRPALLELIRPFLTGGRIAKSDEYRDFRVGRFKDDRDRTLLVVEEYC